MERAMGPALQYVTRRLVELRVEFAEIIVDWRSTEHTDTLPLPLHPLEPLCLDDNAQALHKEDTTEDWQQQFLVNNNSTDADDATNGQ